MHSRSTRRRWPAGTCRGSALDRYTQSDFMSRTLRFLWDATRGHHLAPWRSPYLRWRIETYSGVKMKEIGFLEFWEFVWRERKNLSRFLKWAAEMETYARPKSSQ